MNAEVIPLVRAQTPSLAASLAKAQSEIQNPKFDSMNPHFKSKFASLAAVRNAIIPVFARHGLSVVQDLQATDRGISCLTILLHSSGERMDIGPLVMPASKADAQGFGSAATYARRYALLAMAGVAGEEDDDGNAASKPNGSAFITEQQAADLVALCDEIGVEHVKLKKHLKVNSFTELKASEYASVVAKVEAKRK
jgi:hypothetical protein